MIDGLKPYAESKPSGLPWLGQVPVHWELRKLKHLTRLINGIAFKPSDWRPKGVPIIRIQNLNGAQTFNFTDRRDLPPELLIERGDLLFSWSGNRGTSFGPFEWENETPGYLNQHIFKLTDFAVPKRYFYYLLRSATSHIEEQAGGIIGLVHITKPELGRTVLPVAPAAEAVAISKFLDHSNRRIDGAIEAKRQTIALLNEQKQAIVHQAVTRGLDPSVPLKPSGLPWLSEIPTGWEVVRAKSVFDAIDERTATGAEELLTVSSAKGIVPRSSSNVTMFKAKSYVGHKLCSPGDIVVNSLWAWAGGLGLSSHRGIISTAYSVYRPKPQFVSYAAYLHELLRSRAYIWELTVRSKGIWVSRLQLSDESFMAMPLVLPPPEEAAQITRHLKSALADIDASVNTLERQIELLIEYRTRLTSDVVTGKLDVREAAKSLVDPDEGTPAAPDLPPDELDDEIEAVGAA